MFNLADHIEELTAHFESLTIEDWAEHTGQDIVPCDHCTNGKDLFGGECEYCKDGKMLVEKVREPVDLGEPQGICSCGKPGWTQSLLCFTGTFCKFCYAKAYDQMIEDQGL